VNCAASIARSRWRGTNGEFGPDWYGYALANPLRFTDAWGLDPCFAQLKYRPVDDWRAGLFGRTHAFWYAQGSDGKQCILSGGPAGSPQTLNVWINLDIKGGSDNVSAPVWWDSGLSERNCKGVDAMINVARRWPQDTIRYDPVKGPNSDTLAHILALFGGFFPSPPPGTMAWELPRPSASSRSCSDACGR